MPSRTCTVTLCPKQKEAYYPDLATYFFFQLLPPLDRLRERKSSPPSTRTLPGGTRCGEGTPRVLDRRGNNPVLSSSAYLQ